MFPLPPQQFWLNPPHVRGKSTEVNFEGSLVSTRSHGPMTHDSRHWIWVGGCLSGVAHCTGLPCGFCGQELEWISELIAFIVTTVRDVSAQ